MNKVIFKKSYFSGPIAEWGGNWSSKSKYRECGPLLFPGAIPQLNPLNPIPQLALQGPRQIKNCSGILGVFQVGGKFCNFELQISTPLLTLNSVLLSGVTAVAGGLQS